MLRTHQLKIRIKNLEVKAEENSEVISTNTVSISQNANIIDTNLQNIEQLNNNYGWCITSNVQSNKTYSSGDVLEFNSIPFSRYFSNPISNYDTSTYEYTIPEAGKYIMGCKLYVNSTTNFTIGIYKNNALIASGSGNSKQPDNLNIITYIPENTRIYVKLITGSGQFYMGANHSYFYGFKL